MARKNAGAVTMYNNTAEKKRLFEVVVNHYGEGYSYSEILSNLVLKKAEEIEHGDTRRHQTERMREDINTLIATVARLEVTMNNMQVQLAHLLKGEI